MDVHGKYNLGNAVTGALTLALTLPMFPNPPEALGTHCGGGSLLCAYNRKSVPNIQLCFIHCYITKKKNLVQ